MLFQELCVEKTHWDSSLTEAHKAKFLKILSETENLNQIRVIRALVSSKVNAVIDRRSTGSRTRVKKHSLQLHITKRCMMMLNLMSG